MTTCDSRFEPRLVHRWNSLIRRSLAGFVAAGLMLLLGCASPDMAPEADQLISAPGHASRVEFVVIHYTVSSQSRALHLLTQPHLSAHYLITDDSPARIIQLVPESRAAWHAGVSAWQGKASLNRRSIGIEIVNRGALDEAQTRWQPFQPEQIARLIPLLRGILARHDIPPENVLGHGEVAPNRKVDPGPLFPWQQLVEAGVARGVDETRAAFYRQQFLKTGLPSVSAQQEALQRVGYPAPAGPEIEEGWRAVWRAFQMRYRPTLYDGQPDLESLALLFALAETPSR